MTIAKKQFLRASALLCLVLTWGLPALAGDEEFFRTEVAPLLQRRCLSCHNEELRKGDFSLTHPSDLLDSGYLDLQQPAESYLLELVTPRDGKAAMPKNAEALSQSDRDKLQQWIQQGARWPAELRLEPLVVSDRNWWSLQPLHAAPLPGEVARNPVDAYLSWKLREQQLTPVEQADAVSLLRRLTYDLTGLPPAPAEVAAFQAAFAKHPEQAWATEVDRLLASPAFGEKWGQHWLDLSRYAETHGYDKDKPRNHAWPYRDYVIRSLNEDKPYGQFVREQIAGDVLYAETSAGVLGLGFLAAGPWDLIAHKEVGEGKLDGRIAKHMDRDEMVSAVFNVFMSTTVQCAQCHHHKFDPVRMEDYYRLHAVFSAVDRADRVYAGLSQVQEQQRQELLSRIDSLKAEQTKLERGLQQTLRDQTVEIDRRIAELKQAHGSPIRPEFGYHSQISSKPDNAKWVQLDLGSPREVSEIRIIPAYDDYNGIGAGFGFPHRFLVQTSDDPEFQTGVEDVFDATRNDYPNPRLQSVRINAGGRLLRYVRVTATKLRERKQDYIFALGEVQVWGTEAGINHALETKVQARDSIEASPRWGMANLVDGIFYREVNNDDALHELRDLQARRDAIEATLRTPDLEARLDELQRERNSLEQKVKQFPAGELVYAATSNFNSDGAFRATKGQPRPIHLLHRGDLRTPGALMVPGAPPLWPEAKGEFFAESDWSEGEARAELAKYLTHTDNPLVWRSIANRLWGWTMGTPLVGSPNDFGRGGMLPTHPELLDYLAIRLRDDPQQSLKSIVRLLVTSEAYRRSSRAQAEGMERDAGNTLLWRMNRRRLSAEEFRDSLLQIAGVLRLEQGGPSFQDFVINKPEHSPHYEYHLHDPANPVSHRRTIYRFVVRSQPQPFLTTLDCADPSLSIPRRDESTTALQALTQWNNRLVEYASRQFGKRIEQAAGAPPDRIEFACRETLGRGPTPAEREILVNYLQQHGAASTARLLFNMNAFVYVD
ncbi:MAG: DUF1549 domain-containing protein [Planctomycetaceae bacterium]|nr:DUF1549 domain-containing protein [Planctomycetaceae bacterium]